WKGVPSRVVNALAGSCSPSGSATQGRHFTRRIQNNRLVLAGRSICAKFGSVTSTMSRVQSEAQPKQASDLERNAVTQNSELFSAQDSQSGLLVTVRELALTGCIKHGLSIRTAGAGPAPPAR